MRPGWLLTAFAVVLALVVALAPGATADPASDYAAVKADYDGDHDITSCKFTRDQLVNARNLITPQDDAYEPGFREEVNTEIHNWDAGACGAGGGSGSTASGSFRIVKIKGKVRGRRNRLKEYVRIKNRSARTANLKGWSLRNSRGQRIRFPKNLRVRGHRLLRVVTGCVRRHHRAFRRGSRYYVCRRRQFWRDSGDLSQLLTPAGVRFSQRGYGGFATLPKF